MLPQRTRAAPARQITVVSPHFVTRNITLLLSVFWESRLGDTSLGFRVGNDFERSGRAVEDYARGPL